MRPTRTSYRGFLLRVWGTGDHTEIRTSITDIETGETRVFVEVESLCTWLRGFAPGEASGAEPTAPSGPPVGLSCLGSQRRPPHRRGPS